jgi:tetratricopeptide (TPR) repeat protein
MLSFDASLADDDMLINRQVDIKLRPLFRIAIMDIDTLPQIQKSYFYPTYDKFRNSITGKQLTLTNTPIKYSAAGIDSLKRYAAEEGKRVPALSDFLEAVVEGNQNMFTKSIGTYGKAIEANPKNGYAYINRSTLQAEMVDFVSSIENNIQPVILDEKGTGTSNSSAAAGTKTKVEVTVYNYDQALDDLNKAAKLLPDYAYVYYNMGNIYTLANRMPDAIQSYSKAIEQYPYLADAYFNRGLVQIYLKDTNKGCLDISKSGELGIKEAYTILKKYCIKEK